jgi:hypothetical protein
MEASTQISKESLGARESVEGLYSLRADPENEAARMKLKM